LTFGAGCVMVADGKGNDDTDSANSAAPRNR
jgi:hypothetical protein